MNKLLIGLSLAATALTTAPALADRGRGYDDDDRRHSERHYRTTDNGVRYWRGDDGRNYCRRSNGTTGLLVGAAAGALVGRAIDRRGDRAVGTILGAAGGALLGREVERSSARCR